MRRRAFTPLKSSEDNTRGCRRVKAPAASKRAFTPLELPAVSNRAFTLVELLVVIGIIALLISILLPSLNAARRQADRVKCLAALEQLGQAFAQYSVEYKGVWPMARHQYQIAPSPGWAERRWFDCLGKYILGPGLEMNPAGNAYYAGGPPAGTIWVGAPQIINGNNVLWGCPTWRRYTRVGAATSFAGQHPGYQMNFFTFAPNDLGPSGSYVLERKGKMAYQNLAGDDPALGNPAAIRGQYMKQTQWTRSAERCLLFDSVHPVWTVSFTTALDYATKWPFQPEGALPFPDTPEGATFTLDFNRHGKRPTGNRPNDPSMNVLFCDGHAAFVSCREAYRSMRFN
jgi:prepilin-type N-terminal cleavage/methylation domain-containing protein/prepilin-type processing-associated H-X9-DG protein